MTDRRIFLAVVMFLGGTLLASVVAIAGLAGTDHAVPGILENVAVGCLTGLAGLLARGPSTEPQAVVVTNNEAEPVPVNDAGAVDVVTALVVVLLIVLILVVVGVI